MQRAWQVRKFPFPSLSSFQENKGVLGARVGPLSWATSRREGRRKNPGSCSSGSPGLGPKDAQNAQRELPMGVMRAAIFAQPSNSVNSVTAWY